MPRNPNKPPTLAVAPPESGVPYVDDVDDIIDQLASADPQSLDQKPGEETIRPTNVKPKGSAKADPYQLVRLTHGKYVCNPEMLKDEKGDLISGAFHRHTETTLEVGALLEVPLHEARRLEKTGSGRIVRRAVSVEEAQP